MSGGWNPDSWDRDSWNADSSEPWIDCNSRDYWSVACEPSARGPFTGFSATGVGTGPVVLAAGGGAVAATGLGLLVLLLGGVLVALVVGGLVLLSAGALGAAYLRGAR